MLFTKQKRRTGSEELPGEIGHPITGSLVLFYRKREEQKVRTGMTPLPCRRPLDLHQNRRWGAAALVDVCALLLQQNRLQFVTVHTSFLFFSIWSE